MRRITLDFDGVIHAYSSPWAGADVVSDGPVPGAIVAIQNYQEAGFFVSVYSTRSHQYGGIAAMRQAMYGWVLDHFSPDTITANRVYTELEWPTELLPSVLYVNDNGFRFEGEFPSLEYLLNAKSWAKS